MESVLSIMKALGEAHRLKAFLTLFSEGELCVCELAELLELSAATTSRHMSLLGAAGLIMSEKRGKWVYYSPSPHISPTLLQWITESAENSASIRGETECVREKPRCCRNMSGTLRSGTLR